MPWTELNLANFESRRRKVKQPESSGEPCDRESKLRDQILAFCDSQRPRWKVVWARSDKRSTLPVGAHDLTIFRSGGRTTCIELKTASGKLDTDQTIWKHEMESLGHTVHVVRSWPDFLSAIAVTTL